MRRRLIDLIVDAKRTDPETGSFVEWLVDQLIANGVTVQKWIPVAAETPKEAGEYIVKIAYASAATALWYNSVEDVWFSDDHRDQYPVTHWMPLPELPGGEGR